VSVFAGYLSWVADIDDLVTIRGFGNNNKPVRDYEKLT